MKAGITQKPFGTYWTKTRYWIHDHQCPTACRKVINYGARYQTYYTG